MLSILTGSSRTLNAVARKSGPQQRRIIRTYTTKSNPIKPTKFRNGGRVGTGMNAPGASQPRNTAVPIIDFGAAAMMAKASQGSLSKKNEQKTIPKSQTSASKVPEAPSTSAIGGGQPELKPKSIRRVADTDWYFITSISDTKYFFNRKTGESANKLPQSVADHVGRIVAAAENDAASKNPAQLRKPSSEPSATINASSQSPNATPSSTSTNIPSSSILHHQSTKSGAQQTAASQLGPIPPANVRTLSHPTYSLRDKEMQQTGEDTLDEQPTLQITGIAFTDEQRNKRRAELQEEYREMMNDKNAILDLPDEEIDDILQHEAEEALEPVHPDSLIPAYQSRVEAAQTLTESNLEKTNRSLSEMADRMIMRGETKKLLTEVPKTFALLQDRLDKGVPLTMRERSAFLTGLLILCKVHVHLRQWKNAQKQLETAKLINPEHPNTLLCEAYIMFSQQDFTNAIKKLGLALEQDPRHIEAMNLLAECYLELEEFYAAEEVTDDILKLEPTNYLATVMKSRIAALLDELAEANEIIQKAIRIDQSRPEAYLMEGKLLLQTGQTDSGLSSIHQALTVDKNYAPAFALFGRLLLRQEKFTEASSAFTAALDINPNNIEALIGLSVLAFHNSEWQTMLRMSSRATSIDKGAVEAWFHKGRAELELKQWQSSIASFEYCIALDKRNEEAYIFLGNALHGAGRTADCIARMDQLIAFKPNSAKAYINKGFALQSLGKSKEALPQFEEAIALDPTDNESKMGKVAALHALGQLEQASSYYATFKNAETSQAYEAALKMAGQAKVPGQNLADSRAGATHAPSSSFSESSDDAEIALELARLTESIDKGMKVSSQSAMSMSEDELRDAMEFHPTPDENPAHIAEELEAELARVNEILGRVGLNPISLDPNATNTEHQTIDPSKVKPEDLKDYMDLIKTVTEEAKKAPLPDPKNPEDWQIANSLGLSPEVLKQMKTFTENDSSPTSPVGSVDAILASIQQEMASLAKQQTRETIKKSSKDKKL